jgi:hypothetical protein
MATHRRSMSGLPAEETEKWGHGKAHDMVGKLDYQFDPPPPSPDYSAPQGCGDRWGYAGDRPRGYKNDVRGWVRGAASGAPTMENETGETKPSFDARDPKTGLPRKW